MMQSRSGSQFVQQLFDTKIVYDFEDREYEFSGQTLVDLYDNTPDGPQISRERARTLIAQMARETDISRKTGSLPQPTAPRSPSPAQKAFMVS